jgi:hypothetical protein
LVSQIYISRPEAFPGMSEDRGDGEIARDHLAGACVAALGDQDALGKTFELYADRDAPAPDWPAIFARLAADRRPPRRE